MFDLFDSASTHDKISILFFIVLIAGAFIMSSNGRGKGGGGSRNNSNSGTGTTT